MSDLISDIPREKLKALVEKNGDNLLQDAERCEGLLKDHCGAHRREISALVGALQERIPLELRSSWQQAMTPEAMRARMVQRLEDNRGLAPEVANWAVDAWSYALGVGLGRRSARVPINPNEAPTAFRPDLLFGANPAPAAFENMSVSQRVASDRAGATIPVAPAQPEVRSSTPKKFGVGALALLGLTVAAVALMHRPAPAPPPDDGKGGGKVVNPNPPKPHPQQPKPKPDPSPDRRADNSKPDPGRAGRTGRGDEQPHNGGVSDPPVSPVKPQSAPATAEVRQATDRMINLKARADAAASGVQQIRTQQLAHGYDMRGDILAALNRMQSFLGEANRALNQRDLQAANGYMDKAGSEVSTLENFLGR